MAKNKVSDWSATAASNADIGGISIAGTAPVSNFDNAEREMMSQIAKLADGIDAMPDTFSLGDPADLTKRVRFDVEDIATATTRVIRLPDQDINLGPVQIVKITTEADATVYSTTSTVGNSASGSRAVTSYTPATSTTQLLVITITRATIDYTGGSGAVEDMRMASILKYYNGSSYEAHPDSVPFLAGIQNVTMGSNGTFYAGIATNVAILTQAQLGSGMWTARWYFSSSFSNNTSNLSNSFTVLVEYEPAA